jgi:flavodoxin I
MKKIGLFYGYTGGNTEVVAKKIYEKFDEKDIDIFDLSKISILKLEEYDYYIFGISTIGADNWADVKANNLWDNFFMILEKVDVKGKKAGIFGLGNQILYPDHFIDDVAILAEKLSEQGVQIIGQWPVEGYEFNHSEAQDGDHFLGLAIDEDQDDENTDGRIDGWVKILKKEFGVK